MNNTKYLLDIGLSEDEAVSYLSLLKMGGATASIVAKEVGIKRTTIYPVLKSLVRKGFAILYFKQNKRFYYPQKPNRISKHFQKKIESFNEIIPQLESISKNQIQNIGLRFMENTEELKRFDNDIWEEYKNKNPKERKYYIIGDSKAWQKSIPDFFDKYRKDRAKLKIKTKLLLSHDSNIDIPEKTLLRECKYLAESYKFKSTIDIFANKVLIVGPNMSALAVVIDIPAMTDVFKSVFEILWDLN